MPLLSCQTRFVRCSMTADTRLPAVVMLHTDTQTGEMTALNFYSYGEALRWVAERLPLLESQ